MHHRSGVFGLVSDAWGGAQYATVGLRVRSERRLARRGRRPLRGGAALAAKSRRCATQNPMTSTLLPGVLAMAVIVIVSNVLVQFLVGDWLTWGAFTYPFAFLVTDLMNRFTGAPRGAAGGARRLRRRARLQLRRRQIEGPFGPLVSLRVAIGSATAFLVGQLLDVAVFNRLRAGAGGGRRSSSSVSGQRPRHRDLLSVAFSAALAFIAPEVDVGWANEVVPLLGRGAPAPLWMSLALADF